MVGDIGDVPLVGATDNYDIVTNGNISFDGALTKEFQEFSADTFISEGGSVKLSQATNIPSQMPSKYITPPAPNTPVKVGDPVGQQIGGGDSGEFNFQKPLTGDLFRQPGGQIEGRVRNEASGPGASVKTCIGSVCSP